MNQSLPQELGSESLSQLSKEKLVEIIIEQSKALCELQKIILELQQEVERLKISRDQDSKISSKPPSGDMLKKPENKKALQKGESNNPKRTPGGQTVLENACGDDLTGTNGNVSLVKNRRSRKSNKRLLESPPSKRDKRSV